MPQTPAPIRHEPQNFFRKIAERHRKAQKEHRKLIRAVPVHKKIIMQKNMQKTTYAAPVCNYMLICPETL